MTSSIAGVGFASLDAQGLCLAKSVKSAPALSARSLVTNSTQTDTISTSAAATSTATAAKLTPTGQPGVYIGSDGRQVIEADEVLTASDKSLIIGINGGSVDGGSVGVETLKTDIALSRVNGMLTGSITPSYISGLMQNNITTSGLNAQQSALYAQEGNGVAAQAYAAYASNPGIPMTVLQHALNFLTNGTAGSEG